MAQIQNAGLGEFRLRDLNDEINKECFDLNLTLFEPFFRHQKAI